MSVRQRRKAALAALTNPIGLVDVGARGGIQPHWAWLSPRLRIMAFEADRHEAEQIGAVPAAAASRSGADTILLTRSPGCSSLLRPSHQLLASFPDSRRYDVVAERSVDLVTIDEAIVNDFTADFMKVDAQGMALPILSGATTSLQRCIGLDIESSFIPIYEEERLFPELHSFITQFGFELVDLRPTYWRRQIAEEIYGCKGQLVFCDALYMKTPDAFQKLVRDNDDPVAVILKAFAICEVYGLADYIVAYADACKVSEQNIDDWVARARRRSLLCRPSLPIMWLIGQAFKDIGDKFLSSHWATAEQSLGNKPRHERLTFLG